MIDTDRHDLLLRAHRIAGEARELADEAIRVRDQHAHNVDALRGDLAMLGLDLANTTDLAVERTKERDALRARVVELEAALADSEASRATLLALVQQRTEVLP